MSKKSDTQKTADGVRSVPERSKRYSVARTSEGWHVRLPSGTLSPVLESKEVAKEEVRAFNRVAALREKEKHNA